MYRLIHFIFYLISLLPFRALYLLSDGLYVVLFHMVGYRRKVVEKNLRMAFADKTDNDRLLIEHKFYHWLCDYFVESIKLLSISKEELQRRFTIANSDEVEKCFEEGQSAAAVLGHYCNWEWLSCVGIDLPANRVMGLVYHPLRNRYFDRLFVDLRSHMGGVPIPKQDILRYLVKYRREGVMSLFGYISDQGPKMNNIHLWLDFMNQDTPVFTGSERIIRKMNNAVFYVEMSRPKRGYYTCTYHLITRQPDSLPEHEITRIFFQKLEQTIRKNPEFYLWSHNRWKRTREEFDKEYIIENGRTIPRHQL